MPTLYVDFEGGNDANDGTSYANRVKTITSGITAARVAPGDTVRIMGSLAPTSLGQAATWTTNTSTIELTTAVTAEICDCDSAWTAVAPNSRGTNTTRKEGTATEVITIDASFTTGKVAYFATGTLTLDGYQQVSMWIKCVTGTITAGQLELKLCSDTAGDTPVYTAVIPALGPASSGRWIPISVSVGSDMTTDINSVALYCASDTGAAVLHLDHIIACKVSSAADSLTLTSLIGKNAAGETWYTIKTILGTTVTLDCGPDATYNVYGKYVGTSESVTTYKRETIKPLDMPTATDDNYKGTIQEAGTSASPVLYSGGWNRTDMSTQDGETWLDGQNGYGAGIRWHMLGFIHLEKIGCVRFQNGIFISSACHFSEVNECHGNGNSNAGIIIGYGTYVHIGLVLDTLWLCANRSYGIWSSFCGESTFTDLKCDGNGSANIAVRSTHSRYKNISAQSSALYGAAFGTGCGQNEYDDVTIYNSGTSAFLFGTCLGNQMFRNSTISEAVFVTLDAGAGPGYNRTRIISQDEAGVIGTHHIYAAYGQVHSETSVRHTASGISWKIQPTSSTYCVAATPFSFLLGSFPVNADAEVTVTCWMQRSNTGLTGKLVCRGMQIDGVATDVTDSVTADADTWEQLSISFTPTEAGVVQIEAWAYGGTTYSVYVDDLSITQA
jgi:hypothetical protein